LSVACRRLVRPMSVIGFITLSRISLREYRCFPVLGLICAVSVALAGCDLVSQGGAGRYEHWQTDTTVVEDSSVEGLSNGDGSGHNPASLVDEWFYTGDGFEGTFIQPASGHCNWSSNRWAQEMLNLKHIGFDTIIIQWSEHDDEDFCGPDGDGMCLVERIVAAADEAGGIAVYVGLSLRHAWWNTDNITMRFMGEELLRNKRVAGWIYPRVKQYKSFYGWYIPHEVCDLFFSKDQQLYVLTFYKELTGYLNRLDPLKTVIASGYTNHDLSSIRQFTKWYKMFMEDSGVDVLIFQDGAGLSGRTEWNNILPFADALASLRKKEFVGDVWLLAEIFTQTAGPPIDNREYDSEPADFERVRDQLEALGRLGTKLIVFSYFEDMRPSAGERQTELYEAYRKYLREKLLEVSGSSAP